MAIYGTPITMGGGGGSNDTLPPLLDNFKATRLEGGLVPPVSNAVAFKDIPDGSKIKLVKGSNIGGTVTYGKTSDLNHRIVFDSNDWTKKEFELENDSTQHNISGSDIDQWLNSTKASDWWMPVGERDENRTSPDYRYEQGFLYQLGINDELLMQNFNDININATAKAKVGLPWASSHSEEIPYTFFENISTSDFGGYGFLYGVSGEFVGKYDKTQTYAPSDVSINGWSGKIHPMMEPKPETKVALDVDGSYFMFEDMSRITLSADKMPVSRANALAGAVWVYGEHEPKNVNDGTRIELTRDEVIKPDFIPPITLADIPVSDADTETVVNLKESDGKLHPYLYLSNNHNDTVGGLLLRKNIGTVKGVWCSWKNNPASDTYRYWCENEFMKKILDPSVSSQVINGNIKANFRNSDSYKTEVGSVKCFALSMNEYGLRIGDSYIKDEGPHLPYFSNDKRRIAYNDAGEAIEHYTRTTTTASGYLINQSGQEGSELMPKDVPHGLRPAIFLPFTFKLNATPNKDGSYDMYEESSVQTLATGKTIADLPSKSKVKLGKFNGQDLKWLVCRDSADQSLRLILDGESVGVIGNKMADNHEPNNPDSSRRNYGNNRYIWSNIRQWLNSDKPANQWYTAQHTYDAAPDYTNVAGFLHEWTEKEISVLENASWVVTKHSVDGGGSESFQNKVALPSTTEMGLESNTGGARIDIFNNNEDRVVSGVPYWCRTPYSSNAYDACTIHTGGTLYHYRTDNTGYGVRPLCKPVASTLVSNEPDSDGCYTLVFTPPLERTVVWDKSKNFYARQFTYNSKKQYQTMLEGATTELLLGEVPLPVSNLTISENAGASPTLSWKNPTDKNYHETVVVQKEGSTPPPALQMTE